MDKILKYGPDYIEKLHNDNKLLVVVLCEESQTVTKAFRSLGHEAYSCDLQPCSGGHPEWHIREDCRPILHLCQWDIVICHPPCDFMSRAGARWMYPEKGVIDTDRYKKAMQARDLFMYLLMEEDYKKYEKIGPYHLCVENPLPLKCVMLPKETQIIQPYQFGHPFSKRTHLWLKGLPELKPTHILDAYRPYLPSNTGGRKRGQKYSYTSISKKESSKTFEGIAKAMADQWSEYVLKCIKNKSK